MQFGEKLIEFSVFFSFRYYGYGLQNRMTSVADYTEILQRFFFFF